MQDDTTAEHSEEAEAAPDEATDSTPEPTKEETAQEPEAAEGTSAPVEETASEETQETTEPADEPSPDGDVEAAEIESGGESIIEAAAALEAKTGTETPQTIAPEDLLPAITPEEPPASVAPEEPSAAVAPEGGDEETAEGSEEEEDVDERPVLIVPPPDDGVKRRWYAIHAHSGQEGNVQAALRVKAEQSDLKDVITNVFVPMEEVAEYKSGEKRLSKRKFFPGYVLVQLPEHPEKNADLWHLIKDTPGVTGFIGSRTEPVPLEDSEVLALAEEMRGERERPRQKVAYEIGERVKVVDGAFANFMGNIGEINEDRAKMKVLIEIFERQTSVEVEFWQVEKI